MEVVEECQHDWGEPFFGCDFGPPEPIIIRGKRCKKCGGVLIDKEFSEGRIDKES